MSSSALRKAFLPIVALALAIVIQRLLAHYFEDELIAMILVTTLIVIVVGMFPRTLVPWR